MICKDDSRKLNRYHTWLCTKFNRRNKKIKNVPNMKYLENEMKTNFAVYGADVEQLTS